MSREVGSLETAHREKEKHIDHSEENPKQNCYFCQKRDWV